MKKIILFSCIVIGLLVYLLYNPLPYKCKFWKINAFENCIVDGYGHPIISENYNVNYDTTLCFVKKINAYTINENLFFVKFSTSKNTIVYVKITPKKEQMYVELDVDYLVYSEEEFFKLKFSEELDWVEV